MTRVGQRRCIRRKSILLSKQPKVAEFGVRSVTPECRPVAAGVQDGTSSKPRRVAAPLPKGTIQDGTRCGWRRVLSLQTWRRGIASSVPVDDEDAGGGESIGGAPWRRHSGGRPFTRRLPHVARRRLLAAK
jgi:hypothetical protein